MKRTSSLIVVSALALAVCVGCQSAESAKRAAVARGDDFVAKGKLAEAAVEYRNALKRDAKFGEARLKLAQTYERQGNAAAMLREYVRAADLLPDRADVQVKAATYLLMAGQFEDARTRADKALKIDPKNVDALIIRANATAGLKDVTTAVAQIEEALKIAPEEGRIYTSLGTLQATQGNKQEAEAAFKKAVDVSPRSVEARLALANYYWTVGNAPAVEQALTDARTLNASDPLLNRMLANFYLATNRSAEAEAPLKLVAITSNAPAAKLALADYYLRVKRPNEAVPILTTVAKDKANFAAATLRLADLERTAGHKDAANRQLESIIKSDAHNVTALAMKASWQISDGDPAAGLISARAAVQADASSVAAQFTLGQALAETRDVDGAIKAFNEALRLNPRLVQAQVLLSRLQLAMGNRKVAVQLATEARNNAPRDAIANLTLARSLIATDKLVEAETIVKALVAQYPQVADVQTLDGQLKVAKRDNTAARAAFDRALAIDPDAFEALQALLRLDVIAHSLPAAITRIEARTAKHPDNPALLMLAGQTYAASGDLTKTETALRRVIELDPDEMNAYSVLGRVYVAQHRLADAFAQFDAAAKRRPTDYSIATMAAMILQMQNKADEAQKRYEAIVAASPKAAVAANNLAFIYAERGENLDIALQLAQSAKSQLPDSPEVNDTLGWVYVKKDLGQLAVLPLEASVAKDPKNAVFHFHLGVAYAKAGMKDKARASLQKALEMNPQFDGADLARKTLSDLRG